MPAYRGISDIETDMGFGTYQLSSGNSELKPLEQDISRVLRLSLEMLGLFERGSSSPMKPSHVRRFLGLGGNMSLKASGSLSINGSIFT